MLLILVLQRKVLTTSCALEFFVACMLCVVSVEIPLRRKCLIAAVAFEGGVFGWIESGYWEWLRNDFCAVHSCTTLNTLNTLTPYPVHAHSSAERGYEVIVEQLLNTVN